MMKTLIAATALTLIAFSTTVTLSEAAQARDQIQIVGSSTVYPFSTTVAEQFGKTTDFKTPVVESTGSGGGLKLFCSGVGVQFPDITNSSRAIKDSEIKRCQENGVNAVTEVKIGYDGIVLANSKSAPQMEITRRQLFLALAKDVPNGNGDLQPNPYANWSDIDPSLPNVKIEVLGPPPTSGTRDAFAELAMEGGCKTFDWIKALKKSNKNKYKGICHGIREDGGYVEAGENDVLIIRKLEKNHDAFGIFGYSFLEQSADKIQGTIIEGTEPSFEDIADGNYVISRPLFFYVKNAHVGTIPGIKEYIESFTSDQAWGEDGYLSDKGLIPMPEEEREQYSNEANNLIVNIGL